MDFRPLVFVLLAACAPKGPAEVNVPQPTSAAEACSRVGNPALVLSRWHVCDPSGLGARCYSGAEEVLECRAWQNGSPQAFCLRPLPDSARDNPVKDCPDDGTSMCPPTWACRPHPRPSDGRVFLTCFPPECASLGDAGTEGG